MAAQSTPAPAYQQTDLEFSRVWMKENPSLFTARVLEFLDAHPAESWEHRVRTYNWYVTLTAIAKAAASPAPANKSGPATVRCSALVTPGCPQ